MPLSPSSGRPALFLDRDGVLNELVFYASSGEWESPRTPEDLRLLAGAGQALRALADQGWLLFLVSNQPSFAKGKTSLESLQAVAEALEARLAADGVRFCRTCYCFHHPESRVPGYGPCLCRKPSPTFLLQAAQDFGLDLASSWMIGDQDLDLLCARNAGCRSVLIPCPASAGKRGQLRPTLTVPDLAALAELLPPCPPR